MTEKEQERRMSITDEINLQRIRDKWGKESTVAATDIRFLLSLLDSQAAERILPHWSEPPHECAAFNGLLEPLAHALSSITSETRVNVKVPHSLAEKVWIELWQAERDLLAIQRAGRRATTAMRSACVDAIKSLRATPHGAAYSNAIDGAICKVESLTLDQVEQENTNGN